MKTALALRHVPFEHLGALASLLLGRGYTLHTLDAGVQPLPAEALAAADLVVVLGGPIGAFDDDRYPFLREETDAIARRLAARKPLLGICLGAQLMARALGATVAPMGVKEIGFAPVTLTAEGAASRSRRWPTAHPCCIGMGTGSTCRPARRGWRPRRSARSRHLPWATTRSACNSTWRPTCANSRPG
ncbi:hypothetical protein ACEQUB_01162 [Ralstonia syzygii]|uniref:glutamine amidotransferase-related protein n=1 Tax=Ralstonia syzygii TaxID=28097 RepID=UPI0036F1AF54